MHDDTGRDALPIPSDPEASWTLAEWDGMWRPSMWLRPPPRPHRTHAWHVVAIVALAGYANVIANRFLDDAWHIPFNLGVLAVAVAVARHAGATWTSMGMRRDRIGRGLLYGGVIAGLVAVGIAVAVAIPATRDLFRDDRVIDPSTGEVLFDAFIRIPIATAFYEEALFRGVLFGMFARHFAPLWAALMSSALFGLWHILPTIETLDTNPAGGLFVGIIGVAVAALGTVAGTGAVGLAWTWLRLRANSIAAPWIVHVATNSVALLAALFVVRLLD